MTPAREPLVARRNARFEEEWAFAEDDGTPIDLTGYTGEMQARLYGAQPGDPKIELGNVTSDVEGVWIREPSAGVVAVRIDQATLAAIFDALIGASLIPDHEAGNAIPLVYDLRLTAPSGAEEVWMEGSFTIQPGVTSA